jgi:hypothetical protein
MANYPQTKKAAARNGILRAARNKTRLHRREAVTLRRFAAGFFSLRIINTLQP